MKKINKAVLYFGFLVFLIIAACCIGFYIFIFHDHEISRTPEEWGQLGDYMGGILNPILAFAALCGVGYTISLQRSQLEQADIALKTQSERVDEQIFDTKFFSMLSLYNESIDAIKAEFGGREFQGYAAVKECLHEFIAKAADLALRYIGTQNSGFKADLYPLISGYTEQYLGTSTTFMITSRILEISKLIETSTVRDKRHYHDLFSSYISEETKIWNYIYFIFTRQQGRLPPEYGCQGGFITYMGGALETKLDLHENTAGYICHHIMEIVDEAHAGEIMGPSL